MSKWNEMSDDERGHFLEDLGGDLERATKNEHPYVILCDGVASHNLTEQNDPDLEALVKLRYFLQTEVYNITIAIFTKDTQNGVVQEVSSEEPKEDSRPEGSCESPDGDADKQESASCDPVHGTKRMWKDYVGENPQEGTQL